LNLRSVGAEEAPTDDRWITHECVVEVEAQGTGTLPNSVGHKGGGPASAIDLGTGA